MFKKISILTVLENAVIVFQKEKRSHVTKQGR